MTQRCVEHEDDATPAGPLRRWFGVAMGMAGACALAAQALLELSALEAPAPAWAAQPAPAANTPILATTDAKG